MSTVVKNFSLSQLSRHVTQLLGCLHESRIDLAHDMWRRRPVTAQAAGPGRSTFHRQPGVKARPSYSIRHSKRFSKISCRLTIMGDTRACTQRWFMGAHFLFNGDAMFIIDWPQASTLVKCQLKKNLRGKVFVNIKQHSFSVNCSWRKQRNLNYCCRIIILNKLEFIILVSSHTSCY